MTQPLQHVKDSRLLGNRPKDKCTCKSCDLCGIYRYLTANVFPLLHTNHFPVRKKYRLNKKFGIKLSSRTQINVFILCDQWRDYFLFVERRKKPRICVLS